MTELNYQTPVVESGRITAACVVLLVLGSLYGLGGLCTGIGMGLVLGRLPREPSTTIFALVLGIVSVVLVLYFLGTGITLIWSGVRVGRRSRRAANVAMVVCVINAVLVVGIWAVALVAGISSGRNVDWAGVVAGTVFYGGIAMANAATAWVVKRARAELAI